MGGTLTKELESLRWCQYLRRPAPLGGVGGCGGTSRREGSGSSSTLLGPQVTGHGCGGAWYGSVRGSRTARLGAASFPARGAGRGCRGG
jgi:hypothetical protein